MEESPCEKEYVWIEKGKYRWFLEFLDIYKIYFTHFWITYHFDLTYFFYKYSKSNESFFINGFNKIQNADRHNFTLEASSSETSTTASSEFRVEEDIEIIRDPSTCKKVKKDTDATYRYCARKDSMLSTSSETQMWFGNGERANCFDDSYPCGSSLSSNFPTPNFTSSTPQTNLISSNPSSYKNEHSCFLLDDAELHNLPTRKNSYDSCTSPDGCDLLSSSSHCSPNKGK